VRGPGPGGGGAPAGAFRVRCRVNPTRRQARRPDRACRRRAAPFSAHPTAAGRTSRSRCGRRRCCLRRRRRPFPNTRITGYGAEVFHRHARRPWLVPWILTGQPPRWRSTSEFDAAVGEVEIANGQVPDRGRTCGVNRRQSNHQALYRCHCSGSSWVPVERPATPHPVSTVDSAGRYPHHKPTGQSQCVARTGGSTPISPKRWTLRDGFVTCPGPCGHQPSERAARGSPPNRPVGEPSRERSGRPGPTAAGCGDTGATTRQAAATVKEPQTPCLRPNPPALCR
jgi:hypothetical protein